MTDGETPMHKQPTAQTARRSDSMWRRGIVAALQEPLVHFLLLGAGVFAIYERVANEPQLEEEQIIVSAGKVEHLSAIFSRTWQRPPTRAELEGLVDDYVREEAAYREGKRLRLDHDDTIIRRRIRQKLDFVAEDLANEVTPSNEQLAAYFAEHQDKYRIDGTLSFRQVFFNRQSRGASLEQDAAVALETLRSDPQRDAAELGDRTLLESRYERVSRTEIGSLFGEAFASAAMALEPGSWHGPLASAYGEHLVTIEERQPDRIPELDAVRSEVSRDWQYEHRQRLTEDFYQGMLSKYSVVVDWPQDQAEVE